MRTQDLYLVGAIESVYGTDPTGIDGADGVRLKELTVSPYQGTDNEQAYLGDGGRDRPTRKSSYHTLWSAVADFAGSGVAGRAPAWDWIMRSCGMSSTQHTIDSGTAQAGAASAITLAATASAVDDTYNGMLVEITGGTGDGQTAKITDYNGTTKVATVSAAWGTAPDVTSTYAVYDYITYAIEDDPDAHESSTAYLIDGVTQKTAVSGCRGQVGVSLNNGVMEMNFSNILGLYERPIALAAPLTYSVSNQEYGAIVSADNTTTLTLGGQALCMSAFSLDNLGQTSSYVDLVNCTEVLLSPSPVDGSLTIRATDPAVYSWWEKQESHQTVHELPLAIVHGTVTGNIVEIASSRVQISNIQRTDENGILGYSMNIRCLDGATLKVR